jgi:hypothetical protein
MIDASQGVGSIIEESQLSHKVMRMLIVSKMCESWVMIFGLGKFVHIQNDLRKDST